MTAPGDGLEGRQFHPVVGTREAAALPGSHQTGPLPLLNQTAGETFPPVASLMRRITFVPGVTLPFTISVK